MTSSAVPDVLHSEVAGRQPKHLLNHLHELTQAENKAMSRYSSATDLLCHRLRFGASLPCRSDGCLGNISSAGSSGGAGYSDSRPGAVAAR